jgi:hypothetical protein
LAALSLRVGSKAVHYTEQKGGVNMFG